MYRPTVRYADCYQQYVDKMFQSTHLDRNQIIRAALFAAAYSSEFLKLMRLNQKGDVSLPSPLWQLDQMELWREQAPKTTGEGKDFNVYDDRKGETAINSRAAESGSKVTKIGRRQSEVKGSEGKIQERIQTSGGIQIRIG